MHYTKEELETGRVEFYDKFVNKLRTIYLKRLSKSAQQNFRDKENVLYSFEDIKTGKGIEDVDIDTPSTLYKGIITKEQKDKQLSVSKNEVPLYSQDIILDKVIDREFSELKQVRFADELPEGIVNGDILSSSNPQNPKKWLVENNQKRQFVDISSVFAADYDFSKLKIFPIETINQIPDGDMIE